MAPLGPIGPIGPGIPGTPCGALTITLGLTFTTLTFTPQGTCFLNLRLQIRFP
ncbi:hypothetical protein D3C79_1057070 [compost metagenome]